MTAKIHTILRTTIGQCYVNKTVVRGFARANIREPFRRVVAAAGLNPRKVVPHILRHTAITRFVQAGVDLPTVKRISGHKTLTMVERYTHQHGAHMHAAMDRLETRYATAYNF